VDGATCHFPILFHISRVEVSQELIFYSNNRNKGGRAVTSVDRLYLVEILGHVYSCFSAGFSSRKAEKPKAGTNDKFFNWLLKR
jgi:hypothetical protein